MSFIPKNQLHVDKHLSNVAINFSRSGTFADKIAPIVPVNKQTDLIKVFSQADMWRIDNTVRAPGNEANRVSVSVSSLSYVAKNYALRADITAEDKANADAGFVRSLEEGRVITLKDKLDMDWDRRVAVQVTNTSNVGCSANVGSSWTDLTNSDPYSDINTQIDNIEDGTGYRPNRMVIGGEAFRYLARNNNIIDKTKETALTGASTNTTAGRIADLFELDQITVARSYFNTAQEGQALALSRVFDPHVLLYYAPERPSIETPSLMYSFRWNVAGIPSMQAQRLPYDRARQSEGIQVSYYQDEVITGASFGALVANVTSSQ